MNLSKIHSAPETWIFFRQFCQISELIKTKPVLLQRKLKFIHFISISNLAIMHGLDVAYQEYDKRESIYKDNKPEGEKGEPFH